MSSGGVYLARYLIFLSHLISSSWSSSRRCEIFETIVEFVFLVFLRLQYYFSAFDVNMIRITLWLVSLPPPRFEHTADIWAHHTDDSDFWLATSLADDSNQPPTPSLMMKTLTDSARSLFNSAVFAMLLSESLRLFKVLINPHHLQRSHRMQIRAEISTIIDSLRNLS